MATPDNPDKRLKLIGPGRPTDPALKDEAFALWVNMGRSTRIVAERLGCDPRTIQRWIAEDNWQDRRRQQAAAFLPGMQPETAVALRIAAHNCGIRLQQIAYDAAEHGIKPDLKEVTALTAIVDRGGYSPNAKDSPLRTDTHQSAPRKRLADYASMTDEEIEESER